VTELIIRTLERRRSLAQSLLDGYAAGALGEPGPGEIAGYEAEIAECDAELAELRNS